MPIYFRCPKCRAKVKTSRRNAGLPARCATCSAPLMVPEMPGTEGTSRRSPPDPNAPVLITELAEDRPKKDGSAAQTPGTSAPRSKPTVADPGVEPPAAATPRSRPAPPPVTPSPRPAPAAEDREQEAFFSPAPASLRDAASASPAAPSPCSSPPADEIADEWGSTGEEDEQFYDDEEFYDEYDDADEEEFAHLREKTHGPQGEGEPPAPHDDHEDGHPPPKKTVGLSDVEELVDMTAMVDIVFFLLIFFMTTSIQTLIASIETPTPDPDKVSAQASAGGASDAESDSVTIRVEADNSILFDGEKVAGEQDLKARIMSAFPTGNDGGKRLTVMGHGDAEHGTVVMVLDSAHSAGVQNIRLAVADEEK